MPGNHEQKIVSKLMRLEEYLRYLEELKEFPLSVFKKDHKVHGLVERYLHLVIEVAVDTGKLLILQKELPRPESNAEVFEILHSAKLISDSLYGDIKGVVSFRNILVHDYEKIDREIVYSYLQTKLDVFKELRKVFKKNL